MINNLEIEKRRTFGIISHPDAGKTTLTEKLLLFGGAIQSAGAVKNNKIKKTATSDFMEIEKQRGISVATSVMAFNYQNTQINNQSKILTNTEVLDVKTYLEKSLVITKSEHFECSNIVFCAGLFSDRLAKSDNINVNLKIVGFRGDYYTLTKEASHKVKNLIYPVPNPEFPFLGVHFTRMTNGEIECGPNAVFTFKREGYKKMAFSLSDTLDSLSYLGTWRLFKNHWRFGLNELVKASSKKVFLNHLRQLIPSLTMQDIVPGRSGVRAMALGKNGDIIDDFKIVVNDRNIHVLNAPSPAATACLSIGETISQQFLKLIN